jgi:ClpP class serine protease
VGFGDALSLLFLLLFLQPVLARRLLEAQRRSVLRAIERERGSRVIALIHRQESLGFLGIPLLRYIDLNDSEEVLRAIRMTEPSVPIDLILHTPGGLVLPTSQMAHALKLHPARVTVFVPHYAMSGGTLLALAADEIVMDPCAVLGPVDPQLGARPAASVLRVVAEKGSANVDDQTLIEADVARMALGQIARTVRDLVAEHLTPEQQDRLVEVLATGVMTHDSPIHAEEARSLGLKVSTDMPLTVHALMALHPQAQGGKPNVQYVPVPYGPRTPAARP